VSEPVELALKGSGSEDEAGRATHGTRKHEQECSPARVK